MDVQCIGRPRTDDEFFPGHIDGWAQFLSVNRFRLDDSVIDSILRVGVCLYEILFSEEIVLRLFANVHKTDVSERLIEFAPFAIVVIIDGVIVSRGNEPAFPLGVLCRDVGIHRFEAEVGADFGRNLVAEKIKLPVGEFAAFPKVYRHLLLSLDLLHIRHRLHL